MGELPLYDVVAAEQALAADAEQAVMEWLSSIFGETTKQVAEQLEVSETKPIVDQLTPYEQACVKASERVLTTEEYLKKILKEPAANE